MFGNLGNRIVSSIASLTALVFSSYHGNEAHFSDLDLHLREERLTIECRLQEAFDHDFEEFFRSGKPINVWFVMQVRSGNELVREEFFYHRVEYDPLTMYYEVYIHEDQNNIVATSYAELLRTVEDFEYSINLLELDTANSLEVTLTAYLADIKLDTMAQPFDLMLLWNFKRPVVKKRFTIDELET